MRVTAGPLIHGSATPFSAVVICNGLDTPRGTQVYECICSPSSPPELAAKGCEFLALLMHYALKGPEGAPKAATR